MRTTIKLLFLIFIFGCKNQPNSKIETLSVIKTENSKKQSTESIFDLIINKKESPKNFPDSIAYKFDFSKRFTKKEISELNLDTTKIDLNEYYFLTNQRFLKKQIDLISFSIYYKHQYGDQLEKILKIKKKNSNFDLILAMEGGDSFSHNISTEFINDSTFTSTYVHKEGDIISSKNNGNESVYEYYYETIISKYHFDKELIFNVIRRDTTNYTQRLFYENNKLIKELKISKSEPFIINTIKCYWEYVYTANDSIRKTDFKIIGQNLINFKTRKKILDLDFSKFNEPNHNWDKLDVNKDGSLDFKFMVEHAGAGANIAYATYLFNTKNKQFEYSEIFSDYNVEYDSEKNRISSFMKSGVGNYYYRFKNLKDNRKDVEFIETIHHSVDTIYYTKLINEKLVKEKKIVLGEYENWRKYLERE